jgi:hypothetical protein
VGCGRQTLDGSMVNNGCMLPSQYAVDYQALPATALAEGEINVASLLREQLLFRP